MRTGELLEFVTMKLAALAALTLTLFGVPGDDPETVDFSVLSGFEYQEGMELPTEVTQHDEKTIKLSGFMRREDGADGEEVEFFMLVNDACGCEGTPKLNEIVFCALPEGETTKILPGTIEITGTLYVGEEKEDDIVLALYTMDVDSIDPKSTARDR